MKAILMTAAGNADVLQLRDIAIPELPSPHHLLREARRRRGESARHQAARQACLLPRQAARDTRLRRRGHRGKDRQRGDALQGRRCGVFLQRRASGDEPGCYAEYTTLHEEYCAAKPANLQLAGQRRIAAGADHRVGSTGRARQSASRANHPDPCRRRRRGAYRGAARPPSRRAHRRDGQRRQKGRAGAWSRRGKNHPLPRAGFRAGSAELDGRKRCGRGARHGGRRDFPALAECRAHRRQDGQPALHPAVAGRYATGAAAQPVAVLRADAHPASDEAARRAHPPAQDTGTGRATRRGGQARRAGVAQAAAGRCGAGTPPDRGGRHDRQDHADDGRHSLPSPGDTSCEGCGT